VTEIKSQLNDELANTFYTFGRDERLNGEITCDARKQEWRNSYENRKIYIISSGKVSPFCTVQGKGEKACIRKIKVERLEKASSCIALTMRILRASRDCETILIITSDAEYEKQ
jgi:hypothetical protein